MAVDKANIIKSMFDAMIRDDSAALAAAVNEYPFIALTKTERKYGVGKLTEIFLRDGFIDRYSGVRLVNPAVLRLISKRLPQEFPYHKNWKMAETHPAYWELVPTIDHIHPVARTTPDQEPDSDENLATTSMLRNAAKAHWTLEELGWKLLPRGDPLEWDGLTQWLISYIEKHGSEAKKDPYVRRWYKAACKCGRLTLR